MTTLGLSPSTKTPGVNIALILGGPGTASGAAPKRILLIGNMLESDATGASPAFSRAAGTMALATPTVFNSAAAAGAYAGRGSELHRMSAAVFAEEPQSLVYGCAAADAAGTAASLVLTFATEATSAFTVRVYACGLVFDVPVHTGDTATTIASLVAAAINAQDVLPYTAQNSAGQITLTALSTGPRGNTLTCAFSFISPANVETPITTSGPASTGATTGTLAGGLQVGGEYFFTGGATQDSIVAALAAVATTKFDRIVLANVDATNVDRLTTALVSQSAPTVQIRQQGVVGSIAGISTAKSFAVARNQALLQIVWHYNSRLPVWEAAAQVAAARLAGDGAVGGLLTGESDDPAANLNGLELATVPVQATIADRPLATDIEDALNNGLTPLAPSSARPNFVRVVRSITSRSTANGVQNYAVIDTSAVTICEYVADDMQQQLATTFAGYKLAPNTSDGLPPRAPKVTTPLLLRAFIAGLLKGYEERAILVNVDANMPLLTVVASNVTPGRVDCEIPAACIPGLNIIGGNVRQLAPVFAA